MEKLPTTGFYPKSDRYLVNKLWKYGIHYYPFTSEFVAYFGDDFEWVYKRFKEVPVFEFWTKERQEEFLNEWIDVWGCGDGDYGVDLIALKEGFHKSKQEFFDGKEAK